MIDILTYSGPFPVTGFFDPQTTQLDDSSASPSHVLVAEKRLIPISPATLSISQTVLNPLAIEATPRSLAQRDDLVSVDPLTRAGTLAYVSDGEVNEYQVWDGSNWRALSVGSPVFDVLEVVSDNQVNPLSSVPLSSVNFSVNGIPVLQGITNIGAAVFIDPILVGYNISPLADVVTVQYLS